MNKNDYIEFSKNDFLTKQQIDILVNSYSELEKAENERAPLPRKVRFNPSTSQSASSSHRSIPRWSDNRSRDEGWQYEDYDERRRDDPWVEQSSSGSGYRREAVNRRQRDYSQHQDYDDHKRYKDRDDYKRDHYRRDNRWR